MQHPIIDDLGAFGRCYGKLPVLANVFLVDLAQGKIGKHISIHQQKILRQVVDQAERTDGAERNGFQ